MRRLLCALFGHDVIPTLGRPVGFPMKPAAPSVGFICVRCHMRTAVH